MKLKQLIPASEENEEGSPVIRRIRDGGSWPERRSRPNVAAAVSRSAGALDMAGEKRKLTGQRPHRLQGRRPYGTRRCEANDLVQTDQISKRGKPRISKSCTAECEILRPSHASIYLPPWMGGYPTLHTEVLGRDEMDLLQNEEMDVPSELGDLMSLMDNSGLAGDSSDVNSEISTLSSENTDVTSKTSAHLDQENQGPVPRLHRSRDEPNNFGAGEHSEFLQDHNGEIAFLSNDSNSATSAGQSCDSVSLDAVMKKKVGDLSDDGTCGYQEETDLARDSLNEELTVTCTFYDNEEMPSVSKEELDSWPTARKQDQTPSRHSPFVSQLEDASNKPEQDNTGSFINIDTDDAAPNPPEENTNTCSGIEDVMVVENSCGKRNSGVVSGSEMEATAEQHLRELLKKVELNSLQLKPVICRLEAYGNAQSAPEGQTEWHASNLSQSNDAGGTRNGFATDASRFVEELNKTISRTLKDRGLENVSGEIPQLQDSQSSTVAENEPTSESLSCSRFQLHRGGNETRKSGESTFTKLDSPAISILSLNATTEVPEGRDYPRRDHNDVIHGDTLIGGWSPMAPEASVISPNGACLDSTFNQESRTIDPPVTGTPRHYLGHAPIIDSAASLPTINACTSHCSEPCAKSSDSTDKTNCISLESASGLDAARSVDKDGEVPTCSLPSNRNVECDTKTATAGNSANESNDMRLGQMTVKRPALATSGISSGSCDIIRSPRDSLGEHSKASLPTREYLSFLETLRGRARVKKNVHHIIGKSSKTQRELRESVGDIRASSDDNQADAEDNVSPSSGFPRGHEVPADWQPGQCSSNLITALTAAYGRSQHQKDGKCRRRRRRYSIRQRQTGLKKRAGDSEIVRKAPGALPLEKSRSDSSASPGYDCTREHRHSGPCVLDDIKSSKQRLHRSLSKENFEFKRHYYENLKRTQIKGRTSGSTQDTIPRTKRITSEVTLLKTLDEMYDSFNSDDGEDDEKEETTAGRSVQNSDEDSETLKQQLFLLRRYYARFQTRCGEQPVGTKRSSLLASAVRIRRGRSDVPSILDAERLKTLYVSESVPASEGVGQKDPGVIWKYDTNYGSPASDLLGTTPKNWGQPAISTNNSSVSTHQIREPVLPRNTCSIKSAVESQHLIADAIVTKPLLPHSLEVDSDDKRPEIQQMQHDTATNEAAGSIQHCESDPSVPDDKEPSPTIDSLLGHTHDLEHITRSSLVRKSRSLDAEISPDKNGPLFPKHVSICGHVKPVHVRSRESKTSLTKGEVKTGLSGQSIPTTSKTTDHQSWERSDDDTWCYSINAMLLRANKAQEACDFVKRNNHTFPRSDSAKVVSPVVPKSSTFLSELLKQDSLERQQARGHAARLDRKVDKIRPPKLPEKNGMGKMLLTKPSPIGPIRCCSRPHLTASYLPIPRLDKRMPPTANFSQSSFINNHRRSLQEDVRSGGVLKIRVQTYNRPSDLPWLEETSVAKGFKMPVKNEVLHPPPERKQLPQKLFPLRIAKPIDFTNPDSRKLKRKPLRDIKCHSQGALSVFEASAEISKAGATATGAKEPNFLLDKYSDTFSFYKNPHMDKRTQSILQLFEDNSNNNSTLGGDSRELSIVRSRAKYRQDNLILADSLYGQSFGKHVIAAGRRFESLLETNKKNGKLGSLIEEYGQARGFSLGGSTRLRLDTSSNNSKGILIKHSKRLDKTESGPVDYARRIYHGLNLVTSASCKNWSSERNSSLPWNLRSIVSGDGDYNQSNENSASLFSTQSVPEPDYNQPHGNNTDHFAILPSVGPQQYNLEDDNGTMNESRRGQPSQERRDHRDTEELQMELGEIPEQIRQPVFVEAVLDYKPGAEGACGSQSDTDQHRLGHDQDADTDRPKGACDHAECVTDGGCYGGMWMPSYLTDAQTGDDLFSETRSQLGSRRISVSSEKDSFYETANFGNVYESKSSGTIAITSQSTEDVSNPRPLLAHQMGRVAKPQWTVSEQVRKRLRHLQKLGSSHLDTDSMPETRVKKMTVKGLPLKLTKKYALQPRHFATQKQYASWPGHTPYHVQVRAENILSHKSNCFHEQWSRKPDCANDATAMEVTMYNAQKQSVKTATMSKSGNVQIVQVEEAANFKEQMRKNKMVKTELKLLEKVTECPDKHGIQEDRFRWENIKVPPPFIRQSDYYTGSNLRQLAISPFGEAPLMPSYQSECSLSTSTQVVAKNLPADDLPLTQCSNTTEIREDICLDLGSGQCADIASPPQDWEVCNTISLVSDSFPCEDTVGESLENTDTNYQEIESKTQYHRPDDLPNPTSTERANMRQAHAHSNRARDDTVSSLPVDRPLSILNYTDDQFSARAKHSSVSREFLKTLRGSDILQAVGLDKGRLLQGLQAVVRQIKYVPVFQLRSVEPVEFSPLIVQVNQCAQEIEEKSCTQLASPLRDWTVFYAEDCGMYINSIYTVDSIPTGLFSLFTTQDDNKQEEEFDNGSKKNIKVGRLVHYSQESSDLAFHTDKVFLFGEKQQSREHALRALVTLRDQVQGTSLIHYFELLCGWVPPYLCALPSPRFPPIYQRVGADAVRVGQSGDSHMIAGQQSGSSLDQAIHLPELKNEMQHSTPLKAGGDLINLPYIDAASTEMCAPATYPTLVCVRCGDVMEKQFEDSVGTLIQTRPLATWDVSSECQARKKNVYLARLQDMKRKSLPSDCKVLGAGVVLWKPKYSEIRKSPSPIASPAQKLPDQSTDDQPWNVQITDNKTKTSKGVETPNNQSSTQSESTTPTTILPPSSQLKQNWWEKNKEKLCHQQTPAPSVQIASKELTVSEPNVMSTTLSTSQDKQTNRALHAPPSTPRLVQKAKNLDMAGWGLRNSRSPRDDEKGLMQKEIWTQAIVPPPFPAKAPRRGVNTATTPTTDAAAAANKLKDKLNESSSHKPDYSQHVRNLHHISHNYKSPYCLRNDLKHAKSPASPSGDGQLSDSRITTTRDINSGSSSDSSSDSSSSSGSESATDESDLESGTVDKGSEDFLTCFPDEGGPRSIDDIFKRTLPHSLRKLKKARKKQKDDLGYLREQRCTSPNSDQQDALVEISGSSIGIAISEYDMCSDADEIKELWAVCFPEVDFWNRDRKKKFKKTTNIWS